MGCINCASVRIACCSAGLEASALAELFTAFNPSSICSGYQWSFGSSQAFDQTFSVPANTAMTMVLSGVANAPGVNCGPVTYSLDGTGGAASSIPVNNPWAMVVLAALVGVAGWRLRSSRQA